MIWDSGESRVPDSVRPYQAQSPFAEFVGSANGNRVTQADGGLTVTGSTPAEVGHRAFTAGVELHELRPQTSGLEEIYFQLTSGQEQFAAPPAGSPVAQEATR